VKHFEEIFALFKFFNSQYTSHLILILKWHEVSTRDVKGEQEGHNASREPTHWGRREVPIMSQLLS